ncbi:hypothetical protein [Halioxenophilus sp. WMMB6]|uniref:hypothetical protein n=1 Tax=Halioxenophilus sp. WMMB6 TaxID=3073815 RepID=UPI00295F148D|nr:hypothetical protein [Halioxenophilus sp. WMMB6]
MGIELNVLKELANISVTAVEVASAGAVINMAVRKPEFKAEFHDLMVDIIASYEVVVDNFNPLLAISSESEFEQSFVDFYKRFSEVYLSEISRPRVYAENTFHKNLQFWKLKETQTSNPLVKLNFARLREFIDKWIDNDIWLSMTIDGLFKSGHRLMTEIDAMNSKDSELAYLHFQASFGNFAPYLQLIDQKIAQMRTF